MSERRKHPRVSLSAEVDIASGDNFYAGRTRDISVGGLFIESPVSVPIGTIVAVVLDLGGHRFTLTSEVVWQLLSRSLGSVGLGVRFLELAPKARETIEAFMTTREPLRFDMDVVEDDDDEGDGAEPVAPPRAARPPPLPVERGLPAPPQPAAVAPAPEPTREVVAPEVRPAEVVAPEVPSAARAASPPPPVGERRKRGRRKR